MHPPESADLARIRKALKPDNFQRCWSCSSLEFDWISVMRNATIGFTDGLVVPFALNAGLAFAGDRRLLITAGSAELIAGSISMFCGAALSAWSEGHTYETMRSDLDFNGNRVQHVQGKRVNHPLSDDIEKHLVEHGFPRFMDVPDFEDRLRVVQQPWLGGRAAPARYLYNTLLDHEIALKLEYKQRYPEKKSSRVLRLAILVLSLPRLILHLVLHLLTCSHHSHDHSLKPTQYIGKTYLEMLMAPRFGRGPLRGTCICWSVRPNKLINLDALWAGVAASVSYLLAGLCTILPYLANRPLWMCVLFSATVSMMAVIAFGLFKGFQEMTWRSCTGRLEHGFIEIGVLAITAICSGGAAIGLVLAFDRLPKNALNY